MKISDLQTKLATIKVEHGDLEVYCWNEDCGTDFAGPWQTDVLPLVGDLEIYELIKSKKKVVVL